MNPGTWNFSKIKTLQFCRIFMTPGYIKFLKSWTLQFSHIFMTVHWNSQRSYASVFSHFHDPRYMKLHKNKDASILSNFHDPGYIKILKSRTLQFSDIFMTQGTLKFSKIICFSFLAFSWPPVHENSQK